MSNDNANDVKQEAGQPSVSNRWLGRRYLLEGKPCRITDAAPQGWGRGMVEVAMIRTGEIKYVWLYALTDMSRPNSSSTK